MNTTPTNVAADLHGKFTTHFCEACKQRKALSPCPDCGGTTIRVDITGAHVLDCGHVSTPDGVAAGYGRDTDGRTHCYPCIEAREVAQLLDPTHTTHHAYLSSDGRAITNWPGGLLMHVTRWTEARTGWNRSTLRSVWAKTPDGRTWYGKGAGTGMYITMRATKGGR